MGLDSCWKLADGGGGDRLGKTDVVGVAFWRWLRLGLCVAILSVSLRSIAHGGLPLHRHPV
jgi:hypothetical protein